MTRFAIVAGFRRWLSGLFCVLMAFSVTAHLGHAMPLHETMGETQPFVLSDGDPPCESGHHAAVADCHATSACSLCAPLEAAPPVFLDGNVHLSPLAQPIDVSWVARPQPQPPRLSRHS
jgi:hypothetical protein